MSINLPAMIDAASRQPILNFQRKQQEECFELQVHNVQADP